MQSFSQIRFFNAQSAWMHRIETRKRKFADQNVVLRDKNFP